MSDLPACLTIICHHIEKICSIIGFQKWNVFFGASLNSNEKRSIGDGQCTKNSFAAAA